MFLHTSTVIAQLCGQHPDSQNQTQLFRLTRDWRQYILKPPPICSNITHFWFNPFNYRIILERFQILSQWALQRRSQLITFWALQRRIQFIKFWALQRRGQYVTFTNCLLPNLWVPGAIGWLNTLLPLNWFTLPLLIFKTWELSSTMQKLGTSYLESNANMMFPS